MRARRGLWVAVSVALLAGSAVEARPIAGAPLGLTDLAWPETTRSVRTRTRTKVFPAARSRGELGEIGRDVALAFTQIVASRDRCQAYLAIAPRGWVCAKDVRPSDDAPDPVVAPPSGPSSVLGDYADVRKGGAPAFDSVEAIRGGAPTRTLGTETFVAIKGTVTVDGTRYHRTDQGLVAASRLARKTPSAFVGVDLVASPPPTWPMAWASAHQIGARLVLRDRPAADGAEVGELEKHAQVPVLSERDGFIEVAAGQWLDRRDARIARTHAPPPGVRPGERWIDVDLAQQVLVAYDGLQPVYATLVSTAKRKYITPAGIYRIGDKAVKRRMRNGLESREEWNVADVPYVMSFRKMYALHGAYWHDGFGRQRSHGCVNLSPADAHRLYEWTFPQVPFGWISVEDDGWGTPIRIHGPTVTQPSWRDEDGAEIPIDEVLAAQALAPPVPQPLAPAPAPGP